MTRARERAFRLMKMAARLTALAATLSVLVATSPAPLCDKRAAPVVFRAQGTCGADGLVVASVDGDSGSVSFGNAAVLGLRPNINGRYIGEACPMMLDRGDWEVTDPTCPGDPGATGGCRKTCTVDAVSSGPLQFVCVDSQGLQLCTSTLTVVE